MIDQRIKILQIGLGAKQGGIERCIFNYFKYINGREAIIDFADIYGDGVAFSKEISDMGGNIFSIGNSKKKPLQFYIRFRKFLTKEKYDIVHVNVLSAANLLPILCAISVKDVHVIVHSHNSGIPSGCIRRMTHETNKILLRHLRVEKWACGIKAGKWLWGNMFDSSNVIPNAVDTSIFKIDKLIRKKMRTELGILENDFVLGYIGRLIEQKNPLFLIKIMNELKNVSPNFRMIIVGDGPLYEATKNEIKINNLCKYIKMVGVDNDIVKWYQTIDAFLLPSLFEGLPVVGVEAQAMGIKLFASDRITREIDISNNVKFLSVNNGSEKLWCKEIVKEYRKKEIEYNFEFDMNYDIQCASKMLLLKYKALIR